MHTEFKNQIDHEALYSQFDVSACVEHLNNELKVDGVARFAFGNAAKLLSEKGVNHKFSVSVVAPHDLEDEIKMSDKMEGVEFRESPSEPSITYRLQFALRDRLLDDPLRFSAIEMSSIADGRVVFALLTSSRDRNTGKTSGGFSKITSIRDWQEEPYKVVERLDEMVNAHILAPATSF